MSPELSQVLGAAALRTVSPLLAPGAHEVVVESPDHNKDLDQRTLEENFLVYKAYRERIIDLQRDERFEYILVFKNKGAAAGAFRGADPSAPR